MLEEAGKVINDQLIPNIVYNTNYDETYRDIFSLPVREGRLSIICPEDIILEYQRRSKSISEPLSLGDVSNFESEQLKRVEKIIKDKSVNMRKKSSIKNCLNASKMFAIDLASEKGVSCWLNAVSLKNVTSICPSLNSDMVSPFGMLGSPPNLRPTVCGEPFTVAHARHCPRVSYTIPT